MPIELIVCADYRHVGIQLADRARGIPRHVGKRVWSPLGGCRRDSLSINDLLLQLCQIK